MVRPVRPLVLSPSPSPFTVVLGGITGTVLLSALIYLAPVFGFPFIDVPLLLGGIFTQNETAAFWLGYCLVFIPGAFIFPIVLFSAWTLLPGGNVSLTGALQKGLLLGAVLWVVSGLLLPLAGVLNQLPADAVTRPGFFALGAGVLAAFGVLAAHVVYGLVTALVGWMEQGITTPDAVGWPTYTDAATGPLVIGRHRSWDVPPVPAGGEIPWRAPGGR
jgi:hypothetical protein